MCVVKRIRAAVWPPLSKPAVPAWLSTGALWAPHEPASESGAHRHGEAACRADCGRRAVASIRS